ncbi:uncharacterized protein LOC129907179 [Episyrphus balteatus]|uniref:uncharacterized protein LOC129907179 n=1 Tax=Episyrphus balteatus TaxID=286459 RepID=UPI0024854BA9|nr:uncharacterized protein LOC129907179 [Episyrphus balteatus]
MASRESFKSLQTIQSFNHPSSIQTVDSVNTNRFGWRLVDNTFYAVKFTFDSISINTSNNENVDDNHDDDDIPLKDDDDVLKIRKKIATNSEKLCQADNLMMRTLKDPQDQQKQQLQQNSEQHLLCHRSACTDTINSPREQSNSSEMQQKIKKNDAPGTSSSISNDGITLNNNTESISSLKSIGSFVCRICHNAEHPDRLVSPCICKGSLTYVHTYCLEHWISTSGKTKCELCQFQYETIQTLRYTCLQSLRMWYSHSMSRRALQEDCQMFSLLTLVAFGIIGTILVGIQHYFVQQRGSNMPAVARIWTKGWLLFFLFMTFSVYFLNVYILVRGQLGPWYRWWQSAREIKLILENRKTFHPTTTTTTTMRRLEKSDSTADTNIDVAAATATSSAVATAGEVEMSTNLQDALRNTPIAEQDQEIAIGTVCLTVTYAVGDNRDAEMGGNGNGFGGRRRALVPSSSGSDDTSTIGINNQQQQELLLLNEQQQHQEQEQEQPQNEQLEGQQQQDNNCDQAAGSCIDI